MWLSYLSEETIFQSAGAKLHLVLERFHFACGWFYFVYLFFYFI